MGTPMIIKIGMSKLPAPIPTVPTEMPVINPIKEYIHAYNNTFKITNFVVIWIQKYKTINKE